MSFIELIIFVAILITVFGALVLLLRWILRLDDIVNILHKIEANTKANTSSSRSNKLVMCESCNNYFSKETLTAIKSGQKLCSDCLKMLKRA